jgi:HTH-type transcriptional regulator / antitoxin HigA
VEGIMKAAAVPAARDILKAWAPFKAVMGVTSVRTRADYQRANAIITALLDEVGDDEAHPLADVLDFLAEQVAAWEADNSAIPEAEPAEVLRFLMEQHDLRQEDLADCAPQSRISDYLAGRRAISKTVAKALAARFGVPVTVFL